MKLPPLTPSQYAILVQLEHDNKYGRQIRDVIEISRESLSQAMTQLIGRQLVVCRVEWREGNPFKRENVYAITASGILAIFETRQFYLPSKLYARTA